MFSQLRQRWLSILLGIVIGAALILMVYKGRGQLSGTSTSNGSGAPTGSCISGSTYTDSATGNQWTCTASVWRSPMPIQTGWLSCTQATPCASSATTFYTTGSATTLYRITASVNCSSSALAATAILTIKYTDPSNTVQTLVMGTATCTTLGAASLSSLIQSVAIQNATVVQYSVAVVSAPNYQARIAVYQEGVN